MLLNNCRYKLKKYKYVISLMGWLILVSGMSCASPEPASVIESQVQVAEPTSTTTATSTATQKPTPLPASDTPEPTDVPTPTREPTQVIKREKFEVPYEDRIIRGEIFGQGETAVILAPMFDSTYNPWIEFAKDIASHGYAAVAFNYPGFGISSGKFSWSKVKYDTKAVIDFLEAQGYERIVCIGASLGASGCYDAAMLKPSLSGLVMISDGVSAASEEKSAVLLMPKLLVRGDEDQEVTTTMENIYRILPMPKELIILPYTAHGTDLFAGGDELRDLLVGFLDSLQ